VYVSQKNIQNVCSRWCVASESVDCGESSVLLTTGILPRQYRGRSAEEVMLTI